MSPPVSGGLERIKSPSEEHSTIGKPMLCLEYERHWKNPINTQGKWKEKLVTYQNFTVMTN